MLAKYAQAPILEALCEFQFDPDGAWDLAFPGIFCERMKDRFPNRRQARTVRMGVAARPDAVHQSRV